MGRQRLEDAFACEWPALGRRNGAQQADRPDSLRSQLIRGAFDSHWDQGLFLCGMIVAMTPVESGEVHMTIDELKREAMRLVPTERASLARELLVSLDDLSESDVERLWLEEAERRRLLVESGETKLIPMDEVFARTRAHRAS